MLLVAAVHYLPGLRRLVLDVRVEVEVVGGPEGTVEEETGLCGFVVEKSRRL